MYFFFGECLPEDDLERAKHVGGLPHALLRIVVQLVVRLYMVNYLTARNVDYCLLPTLYVTF